MVIDQESVLIMSAVFRTVGVTLKGIRRNNDRFGIVGEIRENTGIVPVEAGNCSGYLKGSKYYLIIFKYVLLFN